MMERLSKQMRDMKFKDIQMMLGISQLNALKQLKDKYSLAIY